MVKDIPMRLQIPCYIPIPDFAAKKFWSEEFLKKTKKGQNPGPLKLKLYPKKTLAIFYEQT